jgi:hypothetical protein
MAKDDLTKSQKDQVKHYEDANYKGDVSKVEPGMGHNEIIWLRNECKRLVKERDAEYKLRQEAETETILVKGIGINSPEMREALRTIKNLEDRLAELLSVEDSHQKLNGKFQMRITELEQENIELHADNKKLAKQVDDYVDKLRKGAFI